MRLIKILLKPSTSMGWMLGCLSYSVLAAENPNQQLKTDQSSVVVIEEQTWVDKQHSKAHTGIQNLANSLDSWFGTPDPSRPASANLRVILDTEWNKYDDFTVNPRVRGRLRLPVLQDKISVVFGDDSLDNQLQDSSLLPQDSRGRNGERTFNRRQNREENSSLALRWSDLSKRAGIDTDLDLGVRSGNDIFIRAKASKDWQLENDVGVVAEQIYRYGIDSKHYVRTNLEVRQSPPGQPFVANQFHVQYTHDKKEDWT